MSITLETGQKLQGKAGAATAIVVTVYGDEKTASGNAYKRLAQVTLGTGATTIYTVPASTATIIAAITVQSIHAADQSVELWVDPSGTADANRVFKSTGILAGGGADYDGSRWSLRDAAGRPLTTTITTTVPAQETAVTKTASPTALNFDHGLDVTDVAGVPRIDVDETELTNRFGALLLQSGTGTAPTTEGEIGWDSDDDILVAGDGSATVSFAKTPAFGTHAAKPAAGKRGRFYRESDTQLVYYDDGSTWKIFKESGLVVKTADETVNNNGTVQNDDHFFFPIEVNERWFARITILATTVSATPDFLCGWTGPTGATAVWDIFGRGSDASGYGFIATAALGTNPNNAARTIAQTAAFALGAGITTINMVGGVFLADGTHPGTIQFQWAQNTATAENTTELTGSFMELIRLA